LLNLERDILKRPEVFPSGMSRVLQGPPLAES
jgi:hypothetical protein